LGSIENARNVEVADKIHRINGYTWAIQEVQLEGFADPFRGFHGCLWVRLQQYSKKGQEAQAP
jgi:hypothetical protein